VVSIETSDDLSPNASDMPASRSSSFDALFAGNGSDFTFTNVQRAVGITLRTAGHSSTIRNPSMRMFSARMGS
jgi:hypothetical protein